MRVSRMIWDSEQANYVGHGIFSGDRLRITQVSDASCPGGTGIRLYDAPEDRHADDPDDKRVVDLLMEGAHIELYWGVIRVSGFVEQLDEDLEGTGSYRKEFWSIKL